jgi:hypothetical protein
LVRPAGADTVKDGGTSLSLGGPVVASKLLSEAFGDWISVFPVTPAGGN